MALILVTLGFTSVIGQVVLMRELVAIFYGNELVFGLILAWWLLWEATGAWGLGRWAERRGWGTRALAVTLLLAALALPFQVALTRSVRDLLAVTPGAFVPLGQMLWAVGLALAPYCLAHGLGFSLAARLLTFSVSPAGQGKESHTRLRANLGRRLLRTARWRTTEHPVDPAGRAYALESAGAVVGGALFSFVLIEYLDSFQAILLATAVTLIVTARYSGFVPRRPSFAALTLAVGIGASLPLGARLHQATLAWQWPRLAFAGDSRYGRLTITAVGGQRAFFQNGLLAFETESTFPEEVIHLPLLAHPNPRHILLIGGGVAGDLAEIFKHNVRQVTYLELDPLVIEAAQVYLPSEQAAVLDDPRLTLILQDGRRYTKHSKLLFDVIIVDLPEPSTGQLNRFYSLEFFQEVAALLADKGLFSLGLPSAENYWNPELTRRNASVYRTLRQVFPTVLATPGDHTFFLATRETALPPAATWSDRLQARGITTRWVTPAYIRFLLEGDRFQAIRSDLEAAHDVKLNRDLAPVCYFYDLALWVSRFGSGLRRFFETTSLLRVGWLVPLLFIGVVLLSKRPRAIASALVGATGFAGMTLQIVLLLAFQALHGYVYHQVGLLVTAFMAGLALGAGTISYLLSTPRPSVLQSSVTSRRWLVSVQGGLLIYGLALAVLLPLEPPLPGLTFPLLAAIAGALTGAVFPLAAALASSGHRRGSLVGPKHVEVEASAVHDRGLDEPGRVAGLLYGADLVGGCTGAVLASAILVPVLGVVQTCLAVALVAAAGTLLSLYPLSSNSC